MGVRLLPLSISPFHCPKPITTVSVFFATLDVLVRLHSDASNSYVLAGNSLAVFDASEFYRLQRFRE